MPLHEVTPPTLPEAPAQPPPSTDPAPAPVLAIERCAAAPRWLHGGSIPSLDGLRALSIGMVLIAHASLTWSAASGPHHGQLARLGGIGVDLFFVISGFLITLLLLRERRRTGTVSLRAFYVRRGWRILPAYLAFLGTLFILSCSAAVQVTGRDWAGALTYSVNFLPGTSWPVGHLWSLSVEEHFYLAWPLLLLLLGPGRAAALASLYMVAAPVVRLAIWRLDTAALDIDYCTPARIDTIAAGCVLAYLIDRASVRPTALFPSRRMAAGLFLLLVAGLVVSNTVLRGSGMYQVTIRRSVDALCFAGLVWTAVGHTDGILGRVLNMGWLAFIGQLSYSIYLWQQPLLNPHAASWPCRWPVNIVLALALALASFALVERPLLRLRERRRWGAIATSRELSVDGPANAIPVSRAA